MAEVPTATATAIPRSARVSIDELAAALVVAREQERRLCAVLLTVADAYERRVAGQQRPPPRG